MTFDRDAFDQDQFNNSIVDRAVQLSREPGRPAPFQGSGRGISAVTTTPDVASYPDPETGFSTRVFTLNVHQLDDAGARLA